MLQYKKGKYYNLLSCETTKQIIHIIFFDPVTERPASDSFHKLSRVCLAHFGGQLKRELSGIA